MTQILGRYYRHTQALEDAAHLTDHVIAAGFQTDTTPAPTQATPAGDERKLRGIPAIGRGVAGAINGTAPHHHDSSLH